MTQFILAFRAFKSDVKVHKHSAFQIVLAEDNPFDSFSEGRKHENIYGFIVKPQVAHTCKCSNSTLIIINIEPYSSIGQNLFNRFKVDQNAAYFYSQKEIADFFLMTRATASLQEILKILSGEVSLKKKDERIVRVLNIIHSRFNSERISLNEISQEVNLSPSRLGAIFKKEIGSSIFKYLLWMRLRSSIFQLLEKSEKSITEIALESGFYDSSQMTRYMNSMFGISPSALKQKSDLIQFLE